MKKKHRKIVVNDVDYGWTVRAGQLLCIWKNKKIIKTHDIPYRHDITPKLVANLIKDPVETTTIMDAKPCPFCSGLIKQHPIKLWQKDSIVCYHNENCWFLEESVDNYTEIPKTKLNDWNTRK